MRHDTLLFVLVPLFLMVVGALVIYQAGPVTEEDKAPVAKEDMADQAGPQADESGATRGLTPDCEKELRRTADLLRFFGNRIQTGEEIQSVIADMRQQEKKISEVCPELSDR
jgi:hypothetical protein